MNNKERDELSKPIDGMMREYPPGVGVQAYANCMWIDERCPVEPDATLRDQFAMAALTGLLSEGGQLKNEQLSMYSYEIADAMLKAIS